MILCVPRGVGRARFVLYPIDTHGSVDTLGRMSRLLSVLFVFAIFVVTARGEETLTANYPSFNANTGFMFDVVASRDLTIVGFRVVFQDSDNDDNISFYRKEGTHVGSETTSGDWSSADVKNIKNPGGDQFSGRFNLDEPVVMEAGDRYGIYIHRTGAGSLHYGNGEQNDHNAVNTLDNNLLIFEGIGLGATFSTTTGATRVPTIRIYYTLADKAAPRLTIVGKKRVRTDAPRVRIYGIVSDDVEPNHVLATYKKQRGNGSTRKVKKKLRIASSGVFSLNVRTFKGRNRIKLVAKDSAGKSSRPASAIVVGQ